MLDEYTVETEQVGDYRARLVVDMGSEQPDGDCYGDVFSLDYGWRRGAHQLHEGWSTTLDVNLSQIVERFDGDLSLVERYLRAFHEVVAFERVDVRDNVLVCIVTRSTAEAWGVEDFDALTGLLEDWKAWADGEVYGVIVEERVRWSTEADYEDRDTWEVVDSCWGFFGREYAEEEMRTMLDYVKVVTA